MRSLPLRAAGCLAALAVLCFTGVARSGPAEPRSGPAPAKLLALLPEGGSKPTGMLNSAGGMALSSLACDLPTKYPCVSEKYPVRVRVALQFHSERAIVDMQAGAMQAQDMKDQTADLASRAKGLRPGTNRVLRVDPVRTAPAPGGSMVYFGYVVDCSEDTHRERPSAMLHAVARNDLALMTLDIEGVATAAEAAALANGILGRFAAGRFSDIAQP